MRKVTLFTVIWVLALVSTSFAGAYIDISGRCSMQHQQIHQAVNAGLITTSEAEPLVSKLVEIEQAYKDAKGKGTLDLKKLAVFDKLLQKNAQKLKALETRD